MYVVGVDFKSYVSGPRVRVCILVCMLMATDKASVCGLGSGFQNSIFTLGKSGIAVLSPPKALRNGKILARGPGSGDQGQGTRGPGPGDTKKAFFWVRRPPNFEEGHSHVTLGRGAVPGAISGGNSSKFSPPPSFFIRKWLHRGRPYGDTTPRGHDKRGGVDLLEMCFYAWRSTSLGVPP